MKKRSIFQQMLAPMIAIVSGLAAVLLLIVVIFFSSFYEQEIHERNQDKVKLMAGEISTFVDGAYAIAEELSFNPSILTMDTDVQTAILTDCAKRNTYLELLYVQDATGMQIGRSSGVLADRSTRWWFIKIMQEQKAFVSKSYYSLNTGMPCASIFLPMYQNEDMIGVFAVDLRLDYLQGLIEEFSKVEKGELSFVIDGEGVVVAHPDSTQIEESYNYKTLTKTAALKDSAGNTQTDSTGNVLTTEQPFEISNDYKKLISSVMSGESGTAVIQSEGDTYYASFSTITLKGDSDSWSVITLQEKSAAMEEFYQILFVLVMVIFASIGMAIIFITVFAKKLTKPIVSLNELIGNASEGDFTQRADENSKNELGMLAKSFNLMIAKLSGILRNIAIFTKGVVENSGNLQKIEEHLGKVNKSVGEIAKGAEEQNTDVEQVTVRIKEMETRFGQLNEQSEQLREDADASIVSGRKGYENIRELKQQNESTVKMMEEFYETVITLGKQSEKIAEILSTITDIASETQLLSLNASIEAARAGEHGRGFAVVANSIGTLASDSADATANIEHIIAALSQDISDTVHNIVRMKEKIDHQMQAVYAVENAFSELETLNLKTTSGVQNMEILVEEMYNINRIIVDAIMRISAVSQKAAALSEQSSHSLQKQFEHIRDVAESVNQLSDVSMEMEQEMIKFKI